MGALPRGLALAAALLLAGCLGATDAPAPAATGAPHLTANDGPAPFVADPRPFAPEPGATVTFHPVPVAGDDGAPLTGTGTLAGRIPAGACPGPLGAGETARFHLAGHLSVPPADLAGRAVHLTLTATGTGRLAFALQGPEHAHPLLNSSVDVDLAWPLGSAAEGPALVVRCLEGDPVRGEAFEARISLQEIEGVPGPEVPYLLEVPEGATTLLARPYRVGDLPAIAHYTLLAEDGTLLGHHGFGSALPHQTVTLRGPGRYLLHVDHASRGGAQFALDAPDGRLTPMPLRHVDLPGPTGAGEAGVTVPRGALAVVPLLLPAPSGATAWEEAALTFVGDQQPVFAWRPTDHLRLAPGNGSKWTPVDFPLGPYSWDHHAVAEGPHTLRVEATRFDAQAAVRVFLAGA